MKSFFTFFSGMLVTGQLLAQAAPINNCFAAFRMGYSNQFPASCNDRGTNTHSPASLQLLGKRIANGFTWHDSPATAGGSYEDIYGHNGSTTKPAGATFRDCPGTWIYFKLRGVTRNPRQHSSEPILNQYARILHYGNEANPDSIRFEFEETFVSPPFTSFEKQINCEDCFADRTRPTIHCPTQTILFSLSAPTNLDGEAVFKAAKIQVTDVCPLDNVTTYPYRRLTKPGETIHYTTIAYDKAGNRAECTYKVLFTAKVLFPNALADSCFPTFRMVSLEPRDGCNAPSYVFQRAAPTFRMLGKQIADGFSWFRHAMSATDSSDYLYARNGSTVPPTGVVFRDCPANWTYFKMAGFNETTFRVPIPNAYEHTNIYARVRHFGAERNPDSIRIEFSGELFKNYYASFQKDTFCNSCIANDRSAPVIHKCPTDTLTHVLTSSTVYGEKIFQEAGLSISDRCGVEKFMTFPHTKRDAQGGQTIDYKTVAYDAAGNAANPCKFKVFLFTKPLGDTCFPRFIMAGGQTTTTCNEYIAPGSFEPTFQMLGKRMSDGFSWVAHAFPSGSTSEYLYARNGTTTAPTGIPFRTCEGNWVYFKVTGLRITNRQRPSAQEMKDVYVRVRYFGKERNPDSIRVDFAGNHFFKPNYASVRKDTVCDPCLATDVTPPAIQNCPTQVVSYPLDWTPVDSYSIEHATKLKTSDACGSTTSVTFPYFNIDAQIGQTVDYKMQSYDRAGNLATCSFKVKYVQATPNSNVVPVTPQFIENQSVPMIISGLSPNPTNGALGVTLMSKVAQSVDFEVYNAYGQKVYSAAQTVSLGENQLFFDLTKLPAGTYFIQCTDQTVRSEKHTFVKY